MNALVIVAGLPTGLGCWVAINELVPAAPDLRAAISRLDSAGGREQPAAQAGTTVSLLRSAARRLPVPSADLMLLGKDEAGWLAAKITLGIAGLALVPALSALLLLGGRALPWSVPVGGSLVLGTAFFALPDVVTRVNARQKRSDFRHALTSYLDLVALERGAGAAPTEALEAAAAVGAGWAFARISASLDAARKAGQPPWDGLSALAAEIGVPELADVAEIAGVAGQDGAKILDTLTARAESMRGQALAAMKARAGARSTTMVLPIALLAGGFLVLLIFPDFYRLFG
ncbi:MAG: type II secretion system F family protein [Actinobacteria bacterium]|nr:type II secretion system F family protein [Actinomycetota bacterium]